MSRLRDLSALLDFTAVCVAVAAIGGAVTGPSVGQPRHVNGVGRGVAHQGYELTAHAAAVIAAREIDPDWVARVLANPERTEPDRSDPALTHALARIAERADRMLRVVYNSSANPPRVVTAYFDRRQRDRT